MDLTVPSSAADAGFPLPQIGFKGLLPQVYDELLWELQLVQQRHDRRHIATHGVEMGSTGHADPLAVGLAAQDVLL